MDAKKFESDLDKLYELKVKMGNAERSGRKYAMNDMLNAISSIISLLKKMPVPAGLDEQKASVIERVAQASDIIGTHAYPIPPLQTLSAKNDASAAISRQADIIRAALNEFERVGFEWINQERRINNGQ